MALQENQCPACGRFMGYRDCSTENGFDYEYVCRNKNCAINSVSSMGTCVAVDEEDCVHLFQAV